MHILSICLPTIIVNEKFVKMASNVIATSNTGVVYSIEDGKAVKKILKHHFTDILNVDHVNVLKIYNVTVTNDFRYITMELCTQSLYDALSDGKITYNQTFTDQLLDGINFIHQKNFVHRNIKPNNVLINNYGIIKLADGKGSRRVTKAELYGTCQFNSPEILKFYYNSKENVDYIDWTDKSDIFALGCLIHIYMYNFVHPFGKDPLEIEYNICESILPSEMVLEFPYIQMINVSPELRKI